MTSFTDQTRHSPPLVRIYIIDVHNTIVIVIVIVIVT